MATNKVSDFGREIKSISDLKPGDVVKKLWLNLEDTWEFSGGNDNDTLWNTYHVAEVKHDRVVWYTPQKSGGYMGKSTMSAKDFDRALHRPKLWDFGRQHDAYVVVGHSDDIIKYYEQVTNSFAKRHKFTKIELLPYAVYLLGGAAHKDDILKVTCELEGKTYRKTSNGSYFASYMGAPIPAERYLTKVKTGNKTTWTYNADGLVKLNEILEKVKATQAA